MKFGKMNAGNSGRNFVPIQESPVQAKVHHRAGFSPKNPYFCQPPRESPGKFALD